MPLIRRRGRRAVGITLQAKDIATVIERAERRRKELRRTRRVRARVREDGRVRIRILPQGRYSSPPYFRGRINSERVHLRLEGTIRESRQSSYLTWIYYGFCVPFALVFVALLAQGGFGNPGLYVCGGGMVAFGWVGWMLERQRPQTFERESAELLAVLPMVLGPHA